MVKPDMIYQLDLRLREIKQVDKPFGGCCVILFGDPCQLKPVMAPFPWERPLNEKFQKSYDIEPLWDSFQPHFLRTNHRQGEDREYGEMLNRFREGIFNKDDMKIMRGRVVKSRNDSCIPEDRMYIFAWNSEVNEVNEAFLEKSEGELYVSKAKVQHRTLKNFKPRVNNAGQIQNTNLQQTLQFKIGSKVMLTYNLKVADGLTNGAIGIVMGVKLSSDGELQEIHVNFTGKNVGKETSEKFFSHLYDLYGVPCVAIKVYETEFRIGRSNTGIRSSATAVNFPLKLAHAVTSHKVRFDKK